MSEPSLSAATLDGCNDPHDCFHEWPCPTYRAATGETEPSDAG